MSPEEQEDKKKNQQQGGPGVVVLSAAQEKAREALIEAGVNKIAANKLVRDHPTERIVTVVEAAGRDRKIGNRAGWIVEALKRGYTMPVTKAEVTQGGRLAGMVLQCAYHRNPQLGRCPAEDPERSPWVQCEVCFRGSKETALEGQQQEIPF